MLNRVKAVLFDAVGTLLRPRPSVGEVYAAAAARHGLQVTPEIVASRFSQAFASEEQFDSQSLGGRTSPEREIERWRRIVTQVFPDAAEPAALFADLWDHFAAATNWEMFEDVAPALARIRQQVPVVGIASNFDCRLRGICQHLPELTPCSPLLISAEIGWRKPCEQFFRAAERELNLRPAEILLVGDDQENDYQAAQAAGWQAIWLTREPAAGATGQDRMQSESHLRRLTDLSL